MAFERKGTPTLELCVHACRILLAKVLSGRRKKVLLCWAVRTQTATAKTLLKQLTDKMLYAMLSEYGLLLLCR